MVVTSHEKRKRGGEEMDGRKGREKKVKQLFIDMVIVLPSGVTLTM